MVHPFQGNRQGTKSRFRITDDWEIQVTDAPFHTFRGGAYGGLIFTSFDEEKAGSIGSIRSMGLPDDENGGRTVDRGKLCI